MAQPLHEEGSGDARQAPRDVVEAGVAEDQLAHDQRRPPVSEHLAGKGDGAEASVLWHAADRCMADASRVVLNLYQVGPDLRLGSAIGGAYVPHMSTTMQLNTDQELIAQAAAVGAAIAPYAAGHDAAGTFVEE